MNPMFFPFAMAMQRVAFNMAMGIPYKPKKHKPMEEGPAFASNETVVQGDEDETP